MAAEGTLKSTYVGNDATAQNYTIVNVTGAGSFYGCFGMSNRLFHVQVDGVAIYNSGNVSFRAQHMNHCLVRFNTSLLVKSNIGTDYSKAIYKLD